MEDSILLSRVLRAILSASLSGTVTAPSRPPLTTMLGRALCPSEWRSVTSMVTATLTSVLADNGRLSVTILLGNGDATFHAGRIFAAGGEASAVALGDFNHDGKLDVAVANDTLLSTQPGNAAILLG